MRDPGARRRNPLFDENAARPDPRPGRARDAGRSGERGDGPDPADPRDGGRDRDDEHPPRRAEPRDHGPTGGGAGPRVGGTVRGPGLDTAVADLARALQGAQPEATEHLVAAAHELVLAVKTVVDAAESALAAQREALAAARTAGPADPGGPGDRADHGGPAASEPTPGPASRRVTGAVPDRRSRVRHIDLA